MNDGWYKFLLEDGEISWECWDDGKFLLRCSDTFKETMLNHPRVITAYEKYKKEQECKQT